MANISEFNINGTPYNIKDKILRDAANCPITNISEDTPTFWQEVGTGFFEISTSNLLINQPNTNGFIYNLSNSTSNVAQLFLDYDSNKFYTRMGTTTWITPWACYNSDQYTINRAVNGLDVINNIYTNSEKQIIRVADSGNNPIVKLREFNDNIYYDPGILGVELSLNRTVGNSNKTNRFQLKIDENGTASYFVENGYEFRNAIGASSGIWPIEQGGTGASTSTQALINLGGLASEGGTAIGIMNFKNNEINSLSNANNYWETVIKFQDKNGYSIGGIQSGHVNWGVDYIINGLLAARYNPNSESHVTNMFGCGIDSNFNRVYFVDEPLALCNAIQALPLSGGTLTGQLTLSQNGFRTYSSAGFSVNTYGQFSHLRSNTTDTWNINNYNGNSVFKINYESGNTDLTGPLSISTNEYNLLYLTASSTSTRAIAWRDDATSTAVRTALIVNGSNRFVFRQYNEDKNKHYREDYYLPLTSTNSNTTYNILTSKSPVTIAQGGTGRNTITSNAIITGNGTSAVNVVSTKSGAAYATTSNGPLQFGTLPIAQGGTEGSTTTEALSKLGALPLTGGTITDTLILSKNKDASGTNDNRPALIIGGLPSATHIEIDGNEIIAKTNGTSGGTLYLNSDGGGVVSIGNGGLIIGTPLPITSGGTGAATTTAAWNNLVSSVDSGWQTAAMSTSNVTGNIYYRKIGNIVNMLCYDVTLMRDLGSSYMAATYDTNYKPKVSAFGTIMMHNGSENVGKVGVLTGGGIYFYRNGTTISQSSVVSFNITYMTA